MMHVGQTLGKSIGANPGLSRRAIEQEQEYWQRLGNVVDDKLCRVYGAVERNLQSYHQLLKDRANALREVKAQGNMLLLSGCQCRHVAYYCKLSSTVVLLESLYRSQHSHEYFIGKLTCMI